MLKYTLKKLLSLIPKMLIISVILFVGLDMLPGDPLARSIPVEQYELMTEEQLDQMRESLGLNAPVHIRYINWLGNLLKGDLGYSTVQKQSIADMLSNRMPYTMELCVYGLIVATVIGLVFGFVAAVMRRTPVDYILDGTALAGVSIPEFFAALCLMVVFAVELKWFPTGGRVNPDGGSRIPYMVLPIACMAMHYSATLVRNVRTNMIEVMDKEYVKTARSKGISEVVVYIKHAYRNAMIPSMILMCMRLPMLIGGFVVIEQIFSYAGVGEINLKAVKYGDIPVAMFILMLSGILSMIGSTLADLCTGLLDPRVRLE